MELPCINCITLAMCKNRNIATLLRKCRLIHIYLVKGEASKGKTLHHDRLQEMCNYMKIMLHYPHTRGFTMTYHWQDGYRWEERE